MLPEQVNLFGIRFTGYDKEAFLVALEERLTRREKTLILSGNVHAFNLAYNQAWLRELFNRADFIRIDGAGLRLGARLLGYQLPLRITWAEFIWDLASFAAPRRFSLFLLGAKPGVAEVAAARMQERHTNLRVAGLHHGYFSQNSNDPESAAVLAQIATCRPDILLVGMGMPLQECWIHENWERIDATVIMTAGAVFDYVSGQLRRPPAIFTRNGFEWLGRLAIEPQRLWRRYLIGNPLFLWRVSQQRLGWRLYQR
jgi:N-acetylglucosaminyldiphosphoundecaprenol N-acetyl-beta-D-mannosaminyltransferase